METTKKLPKLTQKRKGFVKDYIETGNATEATVKNFNVKDRNVAKTVGSELLTFPNVIHAIEVKRKSLKEALLAKGITEDYLADKVDVLLTARDKDGNDDYTAIDKGLKHATSIFGVIDPEKEKGNTYNFIFAPDVQSEIKQIEDNIKAKLLQRHDKEN